MTAAEARWAALRDLGNVTLLKEQTRDSWGWSRLARLGQDFRYALRQLRRSPSFSATVILTLAFAIGANLAIFQLLYGVLFARLPIAQPSQLYSLRAVKSPFDGQWFFSYPAYQRLRSSTVQNAPVLARSGISDGVFEQRNGSAARVRFQLVSDNFFNVLGLSPVVGRFFLASDEELGTNPQPVVLRYGYWNQYFGADQTIIGKPAVINNVPAVIVGVAPEGFSGVVADGAPDVWLPLAAQASGRLHTWFDSLGPGSGANIDSPYLDQSSVFWLWLLARVPDASQSSSVAQWTQALQPDIALLADAAKDPQDRERIWHAHVYLVSAKAGEGVLREQYSLPLILLVIMAAFVLLIGCVNLANLQLARLLARQRELAIRIALGASRWRLLRQLLAADLLLGTAGAILAFFMGRGASSLLLHWASGSGPIIPLDLRMRWELLAFGGTLLVASLIGFSLGPAWRFTGKGLTDNVNSKSTSSLNQGRTARRWSNLLLTGQVCFSFLLLGMAGLFAQTLLGLSHLNVGLDREHVISIHLDLTNGGYQEADLPGLYSRLITRLKELPGVQDAATQMCAIPGCVWNTAIHVSGHPELPEKQLHGEENRVGSGYFHTMGIPILNGRDFDASDVSGSQPVAILNQRFARNLFGSEDPVGRRIGYEPAPNDSKYVVVGECGDAQVDDLRSPAPAVAYFSVDQRPRAVGTIEVRVAGSVRPFYSLLRESLLSVDRRLPITDILPLDAEYADGLSREVLLSRLTGVFALLALALAALGFYGLLSFNVTRRTPEIGIRISVGASPAKIRALIFRETAVILLAGILPGVMLTEIMGRVARGLLYGSAAIDFWALSFAVSVLSTVGMLAGLVPAVRAASVDPIKALRAD